MNIEKYGVCRRGSEKEDKYEKESINASLNNDFIRQEIIDCAEDDR